MLCYSSWLGVHGIVHYLVFQTRALKRLKSALSRNYYDDNSGHQQFKDGHHLKTRHRFNGHSIAKVYEPLLIRKYLNYKANNMLETDHPDVDHTIILSLMVLNMLS